MKKQVFQLVIFLVLILAFQYKALEYYLPIEFIYEKMVALAWLLVGVYFVCYGDNIIARVFLVTSINNLLDELFFNPLIWNMNDTIFTILCIMLLFNAFNHPSNLLRNAK